MSGKITELFLELLRSGLWQTLPDDSILCEPLSQQEWRSLWLIARKQTVQGLVYYGINLLPQTKLPPIMTLASWMVEIERISQDNSRINQVIEEQTTWWHKNALDVVLMKGQTVAELYSDPSLRISGDIDWYFPTEESFAHANLLAKASGCSPEMDSDGDFHYLFNKVVVEHHKSYSELSSAKNKRRLKSIEHLEAWRGVKKLDPLSNLLLLNTHILKHAMVSGIGLRQFCDIAMAYKSCFSDYNNRELASAYKAELDKLGLLKWTTLLHSFLTVHLGLPKEYLPFPIENKFDTEWLFEQVMSDGNFGEHSKRSLFSKIIDKFVFSITYAPREYFSRMFSLVIGRIRRMLKSA